MASSGSGSSAGSGSYSGAAAGKGGYRGSGAGKGSYSSVVGGYGKGNLAGCLGNYSNRIGTGYVSKLTNSYLSSRTRDFSKNAGIRSRLNDFKSSMQSLFDKTMLYEATAFPRRRINLEEYLEKKFRKYKKMCPNCGIDVGYIMN